MLLPSNNKFYEQFLLSVVENNKIQARRRTGADRLGNLEIEAVGAPGNITRLFYHRPTKEAYLSHSGVAGASYFFEKTGAGITRKSQIGLENGQSNHVVLTPDGLEAWIAGAQSPFLRRATRANTGAAWASGSHSLSSSILTTVLAMSPVEDLFVYAQAVDSDTGAIRAAKKTAGTWGAVSVSLSGFDVASKPVYAMDWTPDGAYFAFSDNDSGYSSKIWLCRMVSGVLTQVSELALSGSKRVNDVKWDRGGVYLAVTAQTGTGAGLMMFKRSGDTISEVTVDSGAGPAIRCAWHPDEGLLAGVFASTPFVRLWRRDGDTLVRLLDPDQQATYQGGLVWAV